MAFQVVHGEGVPISGLPFSPAVSVGDFIFVSGQASVDDSGEIVSGTLAQEMRRSFDNLERILAAADAALSDVVRITSYLRDEGDLAEYNRIYALIFSPPFPARTTLTGCLPATLRFEVDAIAVSGSRGRKQPQ